MKKKILYSLLAVVLIIQFFRIDKTNPEIIQSDDFIEVVQPSEEIVTILKSTCYDCHSNETKYPWYSNVAPISWWVKDHINEGREELNFSEWGTYEYKKQDHKLEEVIEMMEDGEMPLNEYTWTHGEAKLTADQKAMLMDWVEATREEMKPKKNVLTLNNGERWATNLETTMGVEKMFAIAKEEVETGRISSYSAMGQKLEIEMKDIFAKCTMTGEGHEQLHNFLLPMVKLFRELSDVEDEDEAMILQKDILKQLNRYKDYFISEEVS